MNIIKCLEVHKIKIKSVWNKDLELWFASLNENTGKQEKSHINLLI